MNTERLLKTIGRDEGLDLMPYRDTKNILTIGIGTNLEAIGWKGKAYTTEDSFLADYPDGITEAEAWDAASDELNEKVEAAKRLAEEKGVDWDSLSSLRQEIIVNMIYNMGAGGVARFPSMWRHLADKNYVAASLEMLHGSRGNLSQYVLDTKMRAVRLAIAMATDDASALQL